MQGNQDGDENDVEPDRHAATETMTDTREVSAAIDAAQQRIDELQHELIDLQIQLLARGTQDVAERARDAVKLATENVLSEFDKLS